MRVVVRQGFYCIYQAFILLFPMIKHCIHPPGSLFLSFCPSISLPLSLSFCDTHSVFLMCGLSLRFGDVDVFFLQSKVCSYAVVPSSDHCRTEIVLSPSEHYCIETVAPSGDNYWIDIVVPSSDHCCNGAVPSSSDHYQTSKVHYSSISPPNSPFLG